MEFNGRVELERVLSKAGYRGLDEAIAELSLFVHPTLVEVTNAKNLFRIVRNMNCRGTIISYGDEIGKVMACDNTGPQHAFKWAIGGLSGKDIQFNHVYSMSDNVDFYTSLANIFVTPAFLAKVTDTSPEIIQLVRYRVYDLYNFVPVGAEIPNMPDNYRNLKWRNFANQASTVSQLESRFREAMGRSPRSRTSKSCREIGWFFSDFKPDNAA